MAQPSRPPFGLRSSAISLQRRQRRIQGISLTELLIGVVISIVVLGAGVQVLVSLIRGDTATQVELNRKDGVSRVLGLMQEEIRDAQRVESGGSLTALSGCSTTPLLVLRGATGAEDISYGLLTQATSATWRGPARVVRCGLPYNTNGQLDTTASRSEQVLVDSLTANGFTASTLGISSQISRNVELTLISDASGTAISNTVQVPINSNQLFGLASSGVTGGCVATGCADPSGTSIHYRPALTQGGSTLTGSVDTVVEDIFYFEGLRSAYNLTETPGTGACTKAKCTVRLGASGPWVTLSEGEVLVFRDLEIRL